MSNTYEGECFCGRVKIEVTGTPDAMGYCHCESCRHWSAGPINAFTLWQPESVQVKQGAEFIKTYAKTENSHRKSCRECGGHLMTEHPSMGLTDVYSAIIPNFNFEPALHVFYGEKVVAVKDGLPKQKDMPAEMGGSGVLLEE